jgi:hypothetical protein
MATEIIGGITYVNPREHAVVSNYKARITEDDRGVQVVEMPTMRGIDGRLMVFGRFITRQEHLQRLAEYKDDSEVYSKKHLKNLGEDTWHS